jgi:hypothetical protein
MNIQQFNKVSHVNYGCISMPESKIELLAHPGEKFKDPADWHHFFPTKIVAKDYMYEIGTWGYGTADQVVNFYEHQLTYEFSKEQNRHIFRFRPWACVHFLDGSKQKIYFDDPDGVVEFSQQMKTEVGLDKHLLVDRGSFVGVGEMKSFE